MNWFQITAKNDSEAEVLIYDQIGKSYSGDGMEAKTFVESLQALGNRALNVRINSPGGAVFAGIAIFNALRRYPGNVIVYVDGLAASIASLIAMAGDRIIMPNNAMLMIHDPSGLVLGGSKDMRNMAESLERIKSSMVTVYAGRTGLPRARIETIMAAETWLTAQEAKDQGFADEVTESIKMAATFGDMPFHKTPRQLLGDFAAHHHQHRGSSLMRDPQNFDETYLATLDEFEAEQFAKQQWASSSALRKEFVNEAAMTAYARAAARGAVRTHVPGTGTGKA